MPFLSMVTLTIKLVRGRDQTCLPCEFGANPFSSSQDISYTNKKYRLTVPETEPSAVHRAAIIFLAYIHNGLHTKVGQWVLLMFKTPDIGMIIAEKSVIGNMNVRLMNCLSSSAVEGSCWCLSNHCLTGSQVSYCACYKRATWSTVFTVGE